MDCESCCWFEYCCYKSLRGSTCKFYNQREALCPTCYRSRCDLDASYLDRNPLIITRCSNYLPNPKYPSSIKGLNDISPFNYDTSKNWGDYPISFGIEFEFNVVNNETNCFVERPQKYPRKHNRWSKHNDGTVTFEYCTPPYINVTQAINNIREQFNLFTARRNTPVPLCWINMRHCGSHTHIGILNEELDHDQALAIAKLCKPIYPFLIAIANNSHFRGYDSFRNYAGGCLRDLDDGDHYGEDHYSEISFSTHGTLEFRRFDGNIPQIILFNAYVLQQLGSIALNNIEFKDQILKSELYNNLLKAYKNNKKSAIKSSLRLLDVNMFLQYLELTNILPTLRKWYWCLDILQLVKRKLVLLDIVKYYGFYSYTSKYYKLMYKHFPNINFVLFNHYNVKLNDVVRSFSDTVNLQVTRLKDLPYGFIKGSMLISNFLTNVEWKDLKGDEARYYGLLLNEELIGVVGIRRSDGYIKHLVIHSNYRNKGYAQYLLKEIIRETSLPSYYAIIDKNNMISQTVFTKLGFRASEYDQEHLKFVLLRR